MKTKQLFLLLTVPALILGACAGNDPVPSPEPEVTPEEEVVEEPDEPYILEAFAPEEVNAAHDTYGFAFGLLRQLNNSINGNVMFSPQSATFALSMLASGAEGETLQELMDVLGYTNMTIDDINAYNRKVLASYVYQTPEVDLGTVTVANALFTKSLYPVNTDFKRNLRKFYGADVLSIDKEAESVINGWVSDKTNGKIPGLVGSEAEQLAFALVNTIYMKAGWAGEFPKEKTTTADFTCSDGRKKKVDMMHRGGDLGYAEGDSYQMVEVYLSEMAYSVFFVLPKDGRINDCLRELPTADWLRDRRCDLRLIDLGVPKLSMKYTADFTNPLKNLGLKKALTSGEDYALIGANFGAPTIMQSTFFGMDEEGIEAAAGTFVGWASFNPDMPIPEPLVVEFDHPYLIIVRHNESHTIPFLGLINNP